jgi:RHS repeat-associated protein
MWTAASGMPIGGTCTPYMLSGTEEVADLDGDRNIIRRYIPGAAIDERVAQIDGSNGAVTFIHNDRQNSVIALSDAVGHPVQRRAYGVYGETATAQMEPATNGAAHPFGYTGRRYDPDLGLYYYRARWYDPSLGTFLQTDPIGSLDYINLYAYVGLEPGNGVDPTGMCPQCAVVAKAAAEGAAVGAVIEVGFQLYESRGDIRNLDARAIGREAVVGAFSGGTGRVAGVLTERVASAVGPRLLGARGTQLVGSFAGNIIDGGIGAATGTAARDLITTGKVRVDEIISNGAVGSAFSTIGSVVGRQAGRLSEAGRRPGGPDFRSSRPATTVAAVTASRANQANDVIERANCSSPQSRAGHCR